MGSSENFCLRWNDFESNVSSSFRELRAEADLFDISLLADAGSHGSHCKPLKAHKLILSACSGFFKHMLRGTKERNSQPLIYLRGVRMRDLESVLDFMYHGEVNVAQEDLNSFLAVAEDLQIKGLTQNNGASSSSSSSGRKPGRKSSSSATPTPSQAKRPRPSNTATSSDSVVNVKADPDDGSGPVAGTSGTQEHDFGDDGGAAAEYDDGFVYEGDDSGMMGAAGDDGAGGMEQQDSTKATESTETTTTTITLPPGITITDESTPADPDDADASSAPQPVVDLNNIVNGVLTFEDGVHTCELCGKKSPWRTTMVRHVEANHLETNGHVCDVCGAVSKTRHAFTMHVRRKHPTLEQMRKKEEEQQAAPSEPASAPMEQQEPVVVAPMEQEAGTTTPLAAGRQRRKNAGKNVVAFDM